ncbi:hypothetical protein ACQEU3_37080 [Spirillospora sp. CA-253888]
MSPACVFAAFAGEATRRRWSLGTAMDGAVLTCTEQSAYFHQGHSAELAEEG